MDKKLTGIKANNSSISISFTYNDIRCRETVKVKPTKSSLKEMARKRDVIQYEIAMGQFDYLKHFPNSKKAQQLAGIQADNITLIQNENGIQQLIAKGKPARYEQILSTNEDKTHAHGETIIYNMLNDELTLIKNAGLKKQGNVFAGEKIVYLIKEQRVKADSTEQDRVRMVIQPKTDKEP